MASRCLLLWLLLSLLCLTHLTYALWWSQGHRPVMDHSRLCRKRGRRVAKDPQSVICRHKPQLVPVILEGAQLAMQECQAQFSAHRWNCSQIRKSLKRILNRDTPETAFLNSIMSAGVTHQVTSACSRGDLEHCTCSRNSRGAINYGLKRKKSKSSNINRENKSRQWRRGDKRRRRKGRGRAGGGSAEGGAAEGEAAEGEAAARRGRRLMTERLERRAKLRDTKQREEARRRHLGGHPSNEVTAGGVEAGAGLPGDAGVVPGGVPQGPESDWHWRGCDDNVGFGYRVARDFMDGRYLVDRSTWDIKSQVLLWNNEAGRRAVRKRLVTHCKCHGLTGSCTHKTCWQRLPPFRSVGAHLRHRFSRAVKVIPSNDGETVIPAGQAYRSPRKQDLVYLEDSPNFCSANKRTGSLGTQGRLCNTTAAARDNCASLCCSRGFTQQVTTVRESCKCRFRYCCEVTCDICLTRRIISHCR